MRRIRLRYENKYYARYQPIVCRRSTSDVNNSDEWYVSIRANNIIIGLSEILGGDEIGFDAHLPNEWVEILVEERGENVQFFINGDLKHAARISLNLNSSSELHFGWDPQIPRFNFEGRLEVDENVDIDVD